jgi:hypothetical protein
MSLVIAPESITPPYVAALADRHPVYPELLP